MARIAGSRLSKLSLAHVVVLVGVFALALTPRLFCQNTDLDSAHDIGMPVYGVFDGDSVVSVQVNNGNVHIEIPIWTAAERGPQVGYKFVYNSKAWQAHENNCPGCVGHVSQDVGSRLTIVGPADYTAGNQTRSTVNCGGSQGGKYTRLSGFFLQEPDGTKHAVYGTVDVPPFPIGCVHQNTTLTMYAEDGSGWMYGFGGTNNGQYTKHGTRIFSTSNGSTHSETVTDANGNQISASSPSSLPGTWTVTDTLGRSLVNDGSYFDSNGTLQHLAITYTTVQFNFSGFCLTCAAGGSPQQLPQTITFPNGMSYTFAYVQNSFGQPSSITLPSGGVIGLTWSGFDKGGPNVQTRTYTDTSGQTSTWTYTQSGSHIGTLTDPLGNDMTVGCFTINFPNTPCYVNQLQYFTGPASGGKVIKTVTTDYLGIPGTDPTSAIMPIRVTTALNVSPGSSQTVVSKVETDYETAPLRQNTGLGLAMTWGNPAARREYDFGSNAAGALLRQTTFTYLHDVSTQYRTTNIADRVLTTVICNSAATCDGTGSNTVAQTQNVYDGGSLVSTGTCSPATGALGHDYCNFGSSNTLRGNPTQTKQWLNPGGIWLSTINAYDDLGHVISTTDPNSNVTLFSYTDNFTDGVNHNALAFATKVTYPITAGVSHIQRKQYFFNTGLLAASCGENFPSASVCANTYSPPQPDYATYAYDIMNRKISVTKGDGGSSTFCYSDMGGATCSQSGPPFKVVTSTTITATTNKVSTALLDGFGRVKQTQLNSDPQGVTFTDTTYDALGRKATVSNPYRSTADTSYGITTYGYDALGRIITVTQPDGVVPTSGNPCPLDNVCTSYSGNQTTVTDEAGNQRTSQVDGLGRLTIVNEAPNQTGFNFQTQYQYDALGNLICAVQKGTDTTAFTNCASAPTTWRPRSFVYDSLSRMTSSANPESGTITYTYDNDGNALTKTAPKANQTGTATVLTTYTYDTLNRLTKKSYNDGSTAAAQYGYDGVAPTGCTPPTVLSPTGSGIPISPANTTGRRSSMCDASGATAWIYDPNGRPTIEERTLNGVTKNVGYVYFLGGQPSLLWYPSGDRMSFEVDAAGRTYGEVDAVNNYVFGNATFAPNGALASMAQYTRSGSNVVGFVTNYQYNKRFQPALAYSAYTGSSGTVYLYQRCYDYHQGGGLNITYGITCSSSVTSPGNNGNDYQIVNKLDDTRTQNFVYDSLNRVNQAYTNGSNWGQQFTIDAWGNLTSVGSVTGKAPVGFFTSSATTKNQLTGYSYDAAGNMLNDGNGAITYDAENRISATAGVTYTYDGDGQRVEKSNGTLYWTGMGSDALDESDLSGNINEEYVIFNGMRVSRVDRPSGTVHGFLTDQLGSSRMMVTPSGTNALHVEQDLDYTPYGILATGTAADHYEFTDKERDSESGLDYFEARHYASSLGRFMSVDPVIITPERKVDPQQVNRYAYVRNNPLRLVDPTGEILQLSGDLGADRKAVCDIVGSSNCDRVSIDEQTEVVSFNTEGLDLSANEGAAVVNDLVQSQNTYDLSIGATVDTAGGKISVGDQVNLPPASDQVANRDCKCAAPTESPKKGVTDQIAINPNAQYKDSEGRTVTLSGRVFHELAEAYSKIDGGKPYSDYQTIGVEGGTRLQVSAPQQGAHNAAVQREIKLRNQRPILQSTGRAGDQLIRDPHN